MMMKSLPRPCILLKREGCGMVMEDGAPVCAIFVPLFLIAFSARILLFMVCVKIGNVPKKNGGGQHQFVMLPTINTLTLMRNK